jgi:hypothetical protein
VLVVVAAFVVGAGACQPTSGGPIPDPDTFGEPPWGAGALEAGLDAVYVGRERPDCSEVFVLTAAGAAHHRTVCDDDVGASVDRPEEWIDGSNGDYGVRDGVLWVRAVSWNGITAAHELEQWSFVVCDGGLRDVPPEGSMRVPFVYELVRGAGPPGAPPCPAS